jgi:hypothetical protein
MKYIFNSLAVCLVLIIFVKLWIWFSFDIPLHLKSVMYVLLIICVLIVRNKWTYFLSYILFALPIFYVLLNKHSSGLSPFDFTNSFYYYFRSSDSFFSNVLLKLPLLFYSLLLVLFSMPASRKLYIMKRK